MGDTSWLGMDVTMEKIYAQQFDFIRGLIAKCGSEFVAIHVRRRAPPLFVRCWGRSGTPHTRRSCSQEHLARHDEYGKQIQVLELQAEEAARKHAALQGEVDVLTEKLNDVPRQIQEAVAESEQRMQAKMDVMQATIDEQAGRLNVLEGIETQRAEHNKVRKEEKTKFWASKRPNVMANLRGVAAFKEAGQKSEGAHGPIGGYPDHDHAKAVERLHVKHDHDESEVTMEHLETLNVPEHVPTDVKHAAHPLSKDRNPAARAQVALKSGADGSTAEESEPPAPPPPTGDGQPGAGGGGGEAAEWLRGSWTSEYLDTHDDHEANLHQWMEDTDSVVHTQARQISVLSKTSGLQRMLLKLQQKKSEEIEGKLDPLIETMKSVQEALDQLPEIQDKLGNLEEALSRQEAIVEGLQVTLDTAVKKMEQDHLLLNELREWRDEYVDEQDAINKKNAEALTQLRSELDEEMEKMKQAFAEAEELLSKLDADTIESLVDKDALDDAMKDIIALLEGQIATRGSKQDIHDLEEQLAKIASVAAEGGSNDAMDALKEGLLLVESRMGSKADMEEMMALKAAIKKLAAARSGGTAGSLTTKSVSMCLACNRPIYQSNEVQKSGANNRVGPGNSSIMAERHRQQGVYKLDTTSQVDATLRGSDSMSSIGGSYSRERPRSQPTPLPMATANMSASASQSSLSAAPTFLPSLPPRGVSRGSNRSVTPVGGM